MNLYYGEIKTPIGTLLVVSDGTNIIRIDYGSFSQNEEQLMKWINRYFNEVDLRESSEKVSKVKEQLSEYFNLKRTIFHLDFSFYGTDFQKKVWQVLLEDIPFGKSKTYKDIAIAIGNPKAVRAVGGAINKNPFAIVVPCHRVMGSDGKLVGYNGGLTKKEFLLKHEEMLV